MTRDELVDHLARALAVPKKDVERILVEALEVIMNTLKAGGTVALSGFGQFSVGTRSARPGVNPRNPSERIHVPAVRVPKFRAGKRLKDRVKEHGKLQNAVGQ